MATQRMHTLMDFRFRRSYMADNGEDGSEIGRAHV